MATTSHQLISSTCPTKTKHNSCLAGPSPVSLPQHALCVYGLDPSTANQVHKENSQGVLNLLEPIQSFIQPYR